MGWGWFPSCGRHDGHAYPRDCFLLVVVGIIAIIQRGRHAGLYQIVWDKIQYNLKVVAQRVAPKVSTK